MAYEYVNSFLLLLHPHFLLKNGGEAIKPLHLSSYFIDLLTLFTIKIYLYIIYNAIFDMMK